MTYVFPLILVLDPKTISRRKVKELALKVLISDGSRVRVTLFLVCVCPIRIRALEDTMERQKLIRMTERSERIYLQEGNKEAEGEGKGVKFRLSRGQAVRCGG